MRTYRRFVILAAAVSVFVALFAVPATAGPAGQFISKINSSRSAAGLPPVEGYWDLADDARYHSKIMAERGELYHSGSLGSVTSGWTGLGENVGVGLDVSSLHQAFMNSSGHRRNILGNYNYVGVGVTIDDDGFMWVTVIFMKAADGLNDPVETTTTTAAPTTTTTTTTSPPYVPPAPTTTTTSTTAPPYIPPAPATTTTTAPSAPTTTTTQAPDAPLEPQIDDLVVEEAELIDGVPVLFYEIWGDHFVYGSPNNGAIAL